MTDIADLANALTLQKSLEAQVTPEMNPYTPLVSAGDTITNAIGQLESGPQYQLNPSTWQWEKKNSLGDIIGANLFGGLTSGIFKGLATNYEDTQKNLFGQVISQGMAGHPIAQPSGLDDSLFNQANNAVNMFGANKAATAVEDAKSLKAKLDLVKAEANIKYGATKQDREDRANTALENKLRSEWNADALYKNAGVVAPLKQAAQDVATLKTPAGDLGLVDILAKAYNPGGIIRPQFMAIIKDAQNPLNRFAGEIEKVEGGGSFNDATRKQMIDAITMRVNDQLGAARMVADAKISIGKNHKLDIENIIPTDQYNTLFGDLTAKSSAPEKTVNGITYKKVEGGWLPK